MGRFVCDSLMNHNHDDTWAARNEVVDGAATLVREVCAFVVALVKTGFCLAKNDTGLAFQRLVRVIEYNVAKKAIDIMVFKLTGATPTPIEIEGAEIAIENLFIMCVERDRNTLTGGCCVASDLGNT